MPVSRRRLKRTLRFKLNAEEEAGSAYDKYFVFCDSEMVGRTQVPRGSRHRTIGDPLLGKIAEELRLYSGELNEVIDCTVELDEYCQIVSQRPWPFRARFL